jgi:hypothetical protein
MNQFPDLEIFISHGPIGLTSIPACRETHRAEKYEGYFDFKQLTLRAHVGICNSSI